jgi:GNAT superfamily N-acetyltransferase
MQPTVIESASLRPLNQHEHATLLSWAAKEGWNPGLEDAELYWQLDPDGYLGIEVDQRFVGGGAIIKHSPNFGFMGLFIIHPDYRSKKLGTKLWYARRDKLLARLESGATIGLDAVDAMVPFYSRGGFTPLTRQVRYEWSEPAPSINPPLEITDLDRVSFDSLENYDRHCFPCRRTDYLRLWTQQRGAQALGLSRNAQLQGWGVMRRCVVGWKIGPLFADTPDDARRLLMEFRRRGDGGPLFVDAPENNSEASKLCQSLGMREVFGCVRMYSGPAPVLMNHRIFSITSFEVG